MRRFRKKSFLSYSFVTNAKSLCGTQVSTCSGKNGRKRLNMGLDTMGEAGNEVAILNNKQESSKAVWTPSFESHRFHRRGSVPDRNMQNLSILTTRATRKATRFSVHGRTRTPKQLAINAKNPGESQGF